MLACCPANYVISTKKNTGDAVFRVFVQILMMELDGFLNFNVSGKVTGSPKSFGFMPDWQPDIANRREY